jgi:hypothetical protein
MTGWLHEGTMPRRPPSRLRRRQYPASQQPIRFSRLPGLSGVAHAAIAHLEDSRLWPGNIEDAYGRWRRLVSGPIRELERASQVGDAGLGYDCDCCGLPDSGRRYLEHAILMLPLRARRELRREIAKLDQLLAVRARRAGAAHHLRLWWM